MPNYTNTLSLANYLFTNKSSVADSFASTYQNNISFLTRGQNGKMSLPTIDQFNAATTPAEQLKIAGNLAKAAQVQTKALAQTGITTRITDMTKAVQEAMTALQTATNGINQTMGAKGLKASATTINSALTTLKESMVQLSRSAKRATTSNASSVNSRLLAMDKTAQAIAEKADLKWTSPLSTTQSSNKGGTTTSHTSRLVDVIV